MVEPEASGIGGDGTAVLFLKGMKRPTVIDYKDQTPIHATPDNPAIMNDGRLVADGPAAANIPGVVAGLDYLHKKYGSGKVKWPELIDPAIRLADEGFIARRGVADQHRRRAAIPRKMAGGGENLSCPAARCRKPGDRFVNKDYANTLRAIANDGADTFYRGEIARKIAADMEQQRRHHRIRRPRPVSRD